MTSADRNRARPRLPLVVALDGPGSSGKSSVGAAAALRVGYRFCDTGLLYRAITWLALARGVTSADPARLRALVPEVQLAADEAGRLSRVLVDGVDHTADVRGPQVDLAVSVIAAVPELRAELLDRQRGIAAAGGIIMAGRDIGTVVLPDADLKLFLDATVAERARRRTEERGLDPASSEAGEILAALRRRDELDATRAVAPLRPAQDARIIATDGNRVEDTTDAVVGAILDAEARRAADPGGDRGAGGDHRVAPVSNPEPIDSSITPLISVVTLAGRIFARAISRISIEGATDEIPRDGPLIIAANHASNLDAPVLGAWLIPKLGRRIHWLGKRELFAWPIVGWVAANGGVHPIDRDSADVEAFRLASRILEGGHILFVFPEGTRSPDGALQAARDGVALLALRTGAPIVPIGIGGSNRVWPKGQRLPHPGGRVIVRVGSPFLPADELPAGTDRRVAKALVTTMIMTRIAALLPERQRGEYGASGRASADPMP